MGSFCNFIFDSVVCSLNGSLRVDRQIHIECRRGWNDRAGPGCLGHKVTMLRLDLLARRMSGYRRAHLDICLNIRQPDIQAL